MTDDTSTSRMRLIAANVERNPAEFIDRVLNTLELYYHIYLHRRPQYDNVQTLREAIDALGRHLSKDVREVVGEDGLLRITQHINSAISDPKLKKVHGHFDADLDLGRLCYVLCRVRKPQTIVETGVANGVTSAFILQALEVNGAGELHSIDLPPLGVYGGSEVGSLVPQDLRHRWQLSFGSSRRLLPPLVEELGNVDLFVHDSLHSYHNVKRELKVVSRHLSPNGIMVVDNVAGNSAFTEWVEKNRPGFHSVVWEGKSILGFALR